MWVFDASIAAAWHFEAEQTPETEALLDRLAGDSASVPSIFHLEIANVLTQAIRKKLPRTTPQKRKDFLDTLSGLPIAIDAFTNEHAWTDIVKLADSYGLSTYDAAYLELAIRLGVELATLGQDLRKAARAAGVPVIP